MFKKILVPLDGSRFGSRALPYAIEIARRFGSQVVLFQVINPTTLIVPTGAGDAMSTPIATQMVIESVEIQNKANITRANRFLKGKLRSVVSHGVNGAHQAVLGDPAEEIIRFCRRESIDLVVMTTSGKGGLKRALLGSVADKIIREPGIHVLAIRPESRRKKKRG